VPHWVPVEPGTAVEAETHYRIEWDDVESLATRCTASERRSSHDFTPSPTDPGRYFIDPRTIPAEPEDPGVAVVVKWLGEGLDLDGIADAMQADAATARDARDLLARIDAARGAKEADQ